MVSLRAPRPVHRAVLLAGAALLLPAAPAVADDVPVDPAPSIALSSPVAGGQYGAGAGVPLTADAAGAISVVSFHIDGVLRCVDLRAPYGCTWSPTAADIGRHVVEARVTDVTGQTASSSAEVTVGRLIPPAVRAATARKRVGKRGWRLTTTGSVAVPAGLSASACSGVANVTIIDGRHTVVDRSVGVTPRCTFASKVSFRAPKGARSVRVKVAYAGAQLLAPRSAPTQTVSLR